MVLEWRYDLLTHIHSMTTIQSRRWTKVYTAINYSKTCHVKSHCSAFVYKQTVKREPVYLSSLGPHCCVHFSIDPYACVCSSAVGNQWLVFKRLTLVSQLWVITFRNIRKLWAKSVSMIRTFEKTEPWKYCSYRDITNAAENSRSQESWPPHCPMGSAHPGPKKSCQSQTL